MNLPTFNPPLAPSIGTTDTREMNLKKLEFGDGYGQAIPQGLNHMRLVRDLTWDALYRDERDEIMAFLDAQGGYKPFLFSLAHDAKPIKWTCEKYTDATVSGGFFRITATFRQDFTLEV